MSRATSGTFLIVCKLIHFYPQVHLFCKICKFEPIAFVLIGQTNRKMKVVCDYMYP